MRLAVGRRNAGQNALQVYSLSGVLLWEALPDVDDPTDLYVRHILGDADGNLYVFGEYAPDELGGTAYGIRKISYDGTIVWRSSLQANEAYTPKAIIFNNSLYFKSSTTLYRISTTDGSVQNSTSIASGRNVFVAPMYFTGIGEFIYAYNVVSSDHRYTIYNLDLTGTGEYTGLEYLFHIDADSYGYEYAIGYPTVEKYSNVDSLSSRVWQYDHEANIIGAFVDSSSNVYGWGELNSSHKGLFKLNSSGVKQWDVGACGEILGAAIGATGKVYTASLATSPAFIAAVTLGSWTLGAGWSNTGTRLDAAADTATSIYNGATIEVGKSYSVTWTVTRLELLTGAQFQITLGGVAYIGGVTASDVTTTFVFGPTTTTDPLTIIAYNPAYPDYKCRPSFLISAFSISELEAGTYTLRAVNNDGTTEWAMDVGSAFSVALIEDPPVSTEKAPYFSRITCPITTNGSHSLSFL